MLLDPPKPPPALAKVIIAPDPAEPTAPPSTPYRTTSAFEAIVALEAAQRENTRLRAARRRSHVGIVLALSGACMSLAIFSAVLVVRHVPADYDLPIAATCTAVPPEAAPVIAPLAADPPDNASAAPELPAPLDELGGEDALRPLAKEVAAALLADPVLRRNPRIAAVGTARLETAVRQSLLSIFDLSAEPDTLDAAELMWEIRPTHAEWAAATAILDKAIEKRGVSESNRTTVGLMVNANETLAVDDTTTRANALARRASVGLSCPEESITSRPLENSESRMVLGCGKRAIYLYVADANTGTSAWHREASP
jgi:hypothetical protein